MVGAVLGAGLSILVWYERDAQRLPFAVETGTSTPLANAGHGFVTSANETTALRTRGGALVAVASSSRVESITAETNREQVLLDRGSVHVRVPGLAPGGSFTVKTPDALVRVKGTTFSVTVASTPRGTETCVKVEEGVVWVERSGTRVVLMKGQHDKCAAFGVNAPGSEPHTTLGSALKGANAGAPTRSRPPERRGTGQSSSSRSPTNGTVDSAILAEQNRLLALALRAERAGHPKEAKQRLQQLLARYPDSALRAEAESTLLRVQSKAP
jgi:hypothetical protein